LIEAVRRNHKVTYLCDASASHALHDMGRTRPIAPFAAFLVFLEKYMKRPTGPHRPYLASSITEKARVANLQRRTRSALASLEKCRADLLADADTETAKLVSLAILQLRMKLNRIGEADMKALCDAMTQRLASTGGAKLAPQGGRGHIATALKLIK
jgi:hypothetical protein